MSNVSRLHLFEAFGIELEYMIVDIETLNVKPIADEVFKALTGEYIGEVNLGSVSWSNELALHVLELKCTKPVSDLVQLNQDFQEAIEQMNELLSSFNPLVQHCSHMTLGRGHHVVLHLTQLSNILRRLNQRWID